MGAGRIPYNACTTLATIRRTNSAIAAIHTNHIPKSVISMAPNHIIYSACPPTHWERHAATPALYRSAGLSSISLRQCRLSANPTSDTSCRGRARSGSGERRRQMFCCATAPTLYSVCMHRQDNKDNPDNLVNTGKLMSNVHNTVHITHDSTSYYHNSQCIIRL